MEIIKKKWDYINEGLKSESHTPIYKMHKYFARRPQNVFAELIKNYTLPNDLILDPFCGGGVTIVEGLSHNRRVITSDINPLATFISKCEITPVVLSDYVSIMKKIRNNVYSKIKQFFITENREKSSEIADVRWYEYAYVIKCPHCSKQTVLSNENKFIVNNKEKNGWYLCEHCKKEIKVADIERIGYKMLTVTYKETTRETQRTILPNSNDILREQLANESYLAMVDCNESLTPTISIPEGWDRQQEDCLLKKGFNDFSNLFTKRTLFAMNIFLKEIHSYKNLVDKNLYDLLLLTFSATLRYTNNMSISTSQWQDGRPVAWAKHAYWLSNQFVEVNPIEYIDKRVTAIISALEYQLPRTGSKNIADTYTDFIKFDMDGLVLNIDSSQLPLPDNSVSAVITDPPYGGNVQYGELSAFWLVWLTDDLGLSKEQIVELKNEILVQRKNKINAKTYQSYCDGLTRVYSECYRVLKEGQPLVFTFNSKDIRVWFALLRAVFKAGFSLEPEGIIYQAPIENYKNTAHTMAEGTIHGDIIYTFVKGSQNTHIDISSKNEKELIANFNSAVKNSIESIFSKSKSNTLTDIYINAVKSCIDELIEISISDIDIFNKDFAKKVALDNMILTYCEKDKESNLWVLKTK